MAWIPSQRMRGSQEDPIRAMSKYVNDETKRFDIGEPVGRFPLHSEKAIIKAMKKGEMKYTPTGGLDRLRELIAEDYSQRFGRTIKSGQVVVTTGATEAISSTIAAYTDIGDRVGLPSPYFPKYLGFIRDARAIPVPVSIVEKRKGQDVFSFNLTELEDVARKHKPKLLIVNSPGNPAGNVASKAKLEGLLEICDKENTRIIFDQIYSRHVYDTTFTSIGQLTDNAAIVDGYSKAEKMTGLRIGFVIAPNEEIATKISSVQSDRTSCPNAAAQVAAIALYENPDKTEKFVKRTVGDLRKRRDFMVKELNSIKGVRCEVPEGAFYAFPNIKGTGMTSKQFTEILVKKANVTTVPGDAFGENGEGYVRFVYTRPIEYIEEGMRRIKITLEDAS